MANNTNKLFKNLNRLFRNGPMVKRKVKNVDATSTASSAVDVFQQARSDIYNSVLSSYGSFNRMARYSDFAEMEATPEISSALDIYAEETVAQDEKNISLHIFSENRKIQEILETLFYDTLNTNFNLPMWTRNLTKYGDFVLYLDVSEAYGIVNAYPIPTAEVEREEGFDPDNPSAYRFRWITQGNMTLENWQVAHFRLLGNDAFLPYGTSVLESARRIWRQLILMEDAMLVYRVIRAPERRVFYIDVGNVPPEDIATYMEEAKSSLKRQPIVNKNDGRVDMRYNPYPIWSESIIPLLDGRHITIRDLATEWEAGKENWVYSVQDETHKLVPGKVTWCGKNYEAQELTKVWLDDGTWIMTAPEHPFLLRDGSSLRADELVPGQSLMPLYRKISSKDNGWRAEGYPLVYDPSTEKDIILHRRVANDAMVNEREEVRKQVNWKRNNNLVVHHKNFNKLDASPANLQWMGNVDHIEYHATVGRDNIIKYNKSEAKRKRTTELNILNRTAQKMGEAYNGTDLHKSHNKIRKQAQLESWNDASTKAKRKEAMQVTIPDAVFDFACKAIAENPSINRNDITSLIREDKNIMDLIIDANKSNNRNISKFHVMALVNAWQREGTCDGWSSFKKAAIERGYRNHKVARIEKIIMEADVYCMTVVGANGEEDRHNFATCGFNSDGTQNTQAAVFIKNSIDEDYFIPVRGGESGTKIDTLAGGVNAAAIEDVQYIQNKLFAALKIPKAYIGYDADIGCLKGDTSIPLIDGRTVTMETLVSEYEAGQENWVYSLSPAGTLERSKIAKAWLTKYVDTLYRVNLSNGQQVTCTDNHPFLFIDGTYIEAHRLQPGTPIMSIENTGILLINSPTISTIKVASVEILTLSEPVPVYDLEIPLWHNFATAAGVVVHNSKATLAQEDIRFSRTIQRIQQTVISELNKIAMIHLFAHGFEGEELINFELQLSNPSSIAQQQKLELIKSRFEIAQQAPQGVVDREWIRKNVMNLSQYDIKAIEAGLIEDKKKDLELESITLPGAEDMSAGMGQFGGPSGGGGGGGFGGDFGGGDLGGAEMDMGADAGEAGGEEPAGVENLFAADFGPENMSLLTALPGNKSDSNSLRSRLSDEEDENTDVNWWDADDADEFTFDAQDTKKPSSFASPIRADGTAKNAFGGQMQKSRKVTDGPLSTHMPNFKSIVGIGSSARKQDTSNDPFDRGSGSLSIKFLEAAQERIAQTDLEYRGNRNAKSLTTSVRPTMTPDMTSMFNRAKPSLRRANQAPRLTVLLESGSTPQEQTATATNESTHENEVDFVLDDE
jgi:hypothetical protein